MASKNTPKNITKNTKKKAPSRGRIIVYFETPEEKAMLGKIPSLERRFFTKAPGILKLALSRFIKENP